MQQHLRNAWIGLRYQGMQSTLDRAWDFARRKWLVPRPVLRLDVSGVPLRLPSATEPLVSIVVPVYNNLTCTLDCLRSLAACNEVVPYEVIVIDDASSDGTREALQDVPGLRYLRNMANSGFIRSCNAGAALARGRYLVLLNNDTLVQPGWLDALLETFEAYPDTGLVGACLLYPDGTLQEAGCIIFSDGRAGNYGRLDAALDPRYTCVRETDYSSGAAVAIPASLFLQLGGFDEHYLPAYYEDADLAMRVRQMGFKVRYQPHSRVVHLEGVTSGVSEEQGVKSHQRSNRFKFAERWAEALERFPPWGTPRDLAAKRAKRLLLIAARPGPEVLEQLGSRRRPSDDMWAVSLFVARGAFDPATTHRLEGQGVEVWQGIWSVFPRGWLRRHGTRFDAIHLANASLAARYGRWCARHAPEADVVVVDRR